MTEQLAALIITAAAHLSLGAFVFSRATDRELKRSFAGLSLTLAAWTFSNGLVTAYAGTPSGVIWARAAFASASLIPVSFLFFVSGFPSAAVRPLASTVIALGATGCAAFIASLTPLIAKHTSSRDGVLTVAYGPLHPFFGTYVLGCLAYTLYFLATKLRRSKGLERLQVSYVFLGIFLAAVGGTITNLLIPVLFHSSRFSPYGPVFSLLMVGLIAHSIVRYRLMDIRLVIRRGATYLLSVALVAAAFVVLAWAASSLFASRPQELPIGAQLVFALLVALMFPALKAHIQNLMDRYFFRETHDYQKTLREITRALASTLDLRSLLTLGCEIITKTVRPEFVAVYAADHADTSYRFLLARHSLSVTEQPHAPSVSASLPFI